MARLSGRARGELRRYRADVARAGAGGGAREVGELYARVGAARARSRRLAHRMLIAWAEAPCQPLGARLAQDGLENLALAWSWADVVGVCALALAAGGRAAAALGGFGARMLCERVEHGPDRERRAVARAMPRASAPGGAGAVFRAVARRAGLTCGELRAELRRPAPPGAEAPAPPAGPPRRADWARAAAAAVLWRDCGA